MNARLQLLYHADASKFALVRELDEWRQEFNRLREALTFAKAEGARELPFLVVGQAGELFCECILTVEPDGHRPKAIDRDALYPLIAETLRTRAYCRLFSNVLNHCWNLPHEMQADAIKHYAAEHGWNVKIHEPGAYGLVADFSLPAY